MKLSDYKQDYYSHTGSASAVARQIAFASIAAIWIFSTKAHEKFLLPNELIISAKYIIFGLTLDLLQYISSSMIWGYFHRHHEKKTQLKNQGKQDLTAEDNDPEINAPICLNWPAIIFFWLKLLFIVVGNIYLIYFLHNSIKLTT